MPSVRLQNLQKIFPGKKGQSPFEAVKSISLEIKDGEFMVLVGPSGCGKTTTLRMIAGLEEPTAGTIEIDGRVINNVLPKDRDIAMVFQNYALYPHMTVFENMAFGLKLRKLPKAEIEERVRDAASILGIEVLLDRKPKALSGGQRQRVAVGRAIVRKPKVFLFDEPLSNLDAKTRASTRREISKLHAKLDATMIYVTHDQVEAMTMGDRICVMNEGKIMQTADPLELYQKPANRFVAGFIGTPAMNFIPGRVVSREGGLCFSGGGEAEDVFQIDLDAANADRFRPYVGKELILGVRPESVCINGNESANRQGIDALVELVEPTGSETLVYLESGSFSLSARISGNSPLKAAQRTKVSFDLSAAHLFDPATGIALS